VTKREKKQAAGEKKEASSGGEVRMAEELEELPEGRKKEVRTNDERARYTNVWSGCRGEKC